ncbi:MAG: DNA repair protein RecN [Endomicrobium sp.]|jgi:DNA repair protein RecN (Recombination protein N)|nr:DNA repair protein RecN [Endomicrobium sp.]
MLTNLSIKNYALIEDLNIDFHAGFTAITGETGAGKSILIKSIELLTGARADSSAIRAGCSICAISAVFECENVEINSFLENLSIPLNDNAAILLRRTVENTGKSKAFINDSPVNLSTLSSLGELLINFHDQNEKHSLLSRESQLEILDGEIPDILPLLQEAKELYGHVEEIKAALEAFNMSEAQRERKIDLYSFQLQEINDANLEPGEDDKIENELPKLKNAEKISTLAGETVSLLYGEDGSALAKITKAKKNIENINNYGADAAEALSLIEQSFYQAQEAYREIESILAKTDLNPEKFNAALERAELIKKLKKKYGSTIEEILNYADLTQKELRLLKGYEENSEKLEKELAKKTENLSRLCAQITQKRKKAAQAFCKAVTKELSRLEINDAVFDIQFTTKEPSANGSDSVEFMFCANRGEKILPLASTASGGELSRVLLAIEIASKSQSSKSRTVIFDEIDTGTGGKTGEKIGRQLLLLAGKKQVFLITHLAQTAAFSNNHIKIYKETQNLRTFTKAKILTADEHIEEIARMISGQTITKSAIEHAKDLINSAL